MEIKYQNKNYHEYANAIKYLISLKHLAEYKRERDNMKLAEEDTHDTSNTWFYSP